MSSGNGFRQAHPRLGPSPAAAHLGVEPGFIDEDPLPVFDFADRLLPRLPLLLDLCLVLFLGLDRLFLSHSPICLRSTTPIEGRLTCSRASRRSRACNSAKVRSGGSCSQRRSRACIPVSNSGLRPMRNTLHLSAAQLLPANLLDESIAHAEAFSQLRFGRLPLAVDLQNLASQIVRVSPCHRALRRISPTAIWPDLIGYTIN